MGKEPSRRVRVWIRTQRSGTSAKEGSFRRSFGISPDAGRAPPSVRGTAPDEEAGVDLRIAVGEHGTSRTISLTGSCDLATAPHLRQTLQGLQPPDVQEIVLDVSNLEFIDSTGLGVVLGAMRRLREAGASLSISGARGIVRRVLEITDLDKVIPMADANSTSD
jgi:anti-sigma B factor antagonist